MNGPNSNGWPPSSGAGASALNAEQHAQAQQRSLASFGPSHPLQQGPPTQIGGPVLPPPPSPFYSTQPNGHALPNLAGLSQASPLQPARGPSSSQQQQSPSNIQHHHSHAPPPPQGQGYALPALGQAMQQQSPQSVSNSEREREYREQELREMDNRERQRQQDAMLQREHDLERERERELREQQQREQHHPPHENHTGSIPLQQPVASRIPSTLHGPNGILSNLGAGAGPNPPSAPLGAPTGPGNVFGNNMHPAPEAAPRPFLQQPGQNIPPQQLLGFNGAGTPQHMQGGIATLAQGQGQQPILNDALSYLDQVKVRFVERPDVYNRFLDIMKDFKSQAIDTPGVIDRVSNLFNGHPELIQGFNTFLPPGYRIECGTRDDPNAIRVTTPMGTTVSQMPTVHDRQLGGPHGIPADNLASVLRQGLFENGSLPTNGNWQQAQPAQLPINSERPFSPSGRSGPPPMFAQQPHTGQVHNAHYDTPEDQAAAANAAAIAHQQEQRGVSQLQNAVSVAANGVQGRHSLMQVSPGGGQGTQLGQAVVGLNNVGASFPPGNQLGMEKRGPVEFNHAISYVNKIKNRFASQPEIYKQFLEILQTYQRESKPIQDVYAQVTQLFSSAPDLLEDFKQFLPESAAQAKAQAAARQATEDAAMLSNVRGESSYVSGAQSMQVQTPRPEMKMPPVGNFAPPPSAGKENKKRRGGPGSQVTGGAVSTMTLENGSSAGTQANRTGSVQVGNANKRHATEYEATEVEDLANSFPKRTKVQPTKPPIPEVPALSPTLVPALPQPMPPSTPGSAGSAEEIAFFDRVKKFVANRQTFNEFLKLCNLFSQDLIDKNVLIHKSASFIGGNPDLMTWFRNFVRYDGRDEIIENKPRLATGKVVLSNCRGLGPSYRLLPKRERLRVCSGRDEMCMAVLNDEWASHPTWASEDSGFVAHRKNTFEEGLHRVEEERHDYDFNIEACLRTIQLFEPIVQQIKLMPEEERSTYVLPLGIGGQSETIYQRVIKKIYDRERGQKVIDDMFQRPTAVIPILLARLKQKVEEWKASQREWEKVWREQTQKMFWKSLDHQGINAKNVDKRQFQTKTIQTEIQAKYEEQKRQRTIPWSNVPKYQFEYLLDDVDVIQDACHLLLSYLHHFHPGNAGDQSRLETFIKTCIPVFFDLDRETFERRMSDFVDASPPNEEVDDGSPNPEESSGSRGRRNLNGRKTDLLRGVLEKGKHGRSGRKGNDGSRESTPGVGSAMDEDMIMTYDTPNEHNTQVDPAEHRWMEHPAGGNGQNRQNPNEPFVRETFNFYCNLPIYCFFRTFQILCERLAHIKANEKQVHNDVRRAKAPKAAHDLKMVDKLPSDFFADTSVHANYYQQVLRMCEDHLKGEIDINHIEETLRRFYLQNGWQLYTFDKMLGAIIRFALAILTNDNKEKSSDIVNLFYKDRRDSETTHRTELDYRKQVEKLVREGDVYRIAFTKATKRVTVQIFRKEDKTFEADELTGQSRWSYYVSTYIMRDQTEGVQLSSIRWPFLKRNLPPPLETAEDYNRIFIPQWNEDGLSIRISPSNYHITYDEGSKDWWVHDKQVRRRGLRGMDEVREERRGKFQEKFVMNVQWMAGMSKDEVDRRNESFRKWVNEGPAATAGDEGEGTTPPDEKAQDVKADADEVMAGT